MLLLDSAIGEIYGGKVHDIFRSNIFGGESPQETLSRGIFYYVRYIMHEISSAQQQALITERAKDRK